jgi:hypothetical protein
MLAIAISVLFGLATLVALAVIHASTTYGVRRARQIMAELGVEERRVATITPPAYRPNALPPLFAAA